MTPQLGLDIEAIKRQTIEDAVRLLPRVPPILEAIMIHPPRHSREILGAIRELINITGLAIQRTEITGANGGPLQNKITIEIVRPLAVTDAESTRQARIPARTIDAE